MGYHAVHEGAIDRCLLCVVMLARAALLRVRHRSFVSVRKHSKRKCIQQTSRAVLTLVYISSSSGRRHYFFRLSLVFFYPRFSWTQRCVRVAVRLRCINAAFTVQQRNLTPADNRVHHPHRFPICFRYFAPFECVFRYLPRCYSFSVRCLLFKFVLYTRNDSSITRCWIENYVLCLLAVSCLAFIRLTLTLQFHSLLSRRSFVTFVLCWGARAHRIHISPVDPLRLTSFVNRVHYILGSVCKPTNDIFLILRAVCRPRSLQTDMRALTVTEQHGFECATIRSNWSGTDDDNE